MATKKQAALKAISMSVDPDPTEETGGGNCPMPTPTQDDPADVTVIVPDIADAAPPAPAATAGGGLPASIAVAVGSPGYYTGARPLETLVNYNARLGAAANTFGDLGWILGTKPKV